MASEAHGRCGERLLRRFSMMLEEHSGRLGELTGSAAAATGRPLLLSAGPRESSVLPRLAATENRLLTKVLLALTAVCSEAGLLEREARRELEPALLLYGEPGPADGVPEIQAARLLPTLLRLLALRGRCRQVVGNLLQQLAALHEPARRRLTTVGFHVQVAFEQLGHLLAALARLDQIMARHALIHEHCALYGQLVRRARSRPQLYGLDVPRVALLERLLRDLEARVLSATLLETALDQPPAVLADRELRDEFLLTVSNLLLALEQDDPDSEVPDLVGMAALVALHARLARSADAKTVKRLWAAGRRLPPVLLGGGLVWSLDTFLANHLPGFDQIVDRRTRDAAASAAVAALTSAVAGLPRAVCQQTVQVVAWSAQLMARRSDDPAQTTAASVADGLALLRRGLALALQVRDAARQLLELHAHTGRPLPAATAVLVCRQLELLKALLSAAEQAEPWVRQTAWCAARHAQFRAVRAVAAVRARVATDKKLLAERLDLVSGLETAARAIGGPATRQRHLLARLSLSLCTQPGVFRDGELGQLAELLRGVQLASRLWQRLCAAAHCDFVYWSRSLVPAYLRDAVARPDDWCRLQLMCAALVDAASLLRRGRHLAPDRLVRAYEHELGAALRAALLEPLCAQVETELRLDVHSHLQLADRNPFKVGLRDRRLLLRAAPLPLVAGRLSVRRYCERYLERTFYHLTAVAQHDWRTYAEMRRLARHRYGLETTEPHLPGQTLEQGLDVLEVMRNIHVFVAHYAYNLTNQFFVERCSNNKHLNTLGISHLANSIRTHGTGVINTTVNFTYQFLRNKLSVLSQFLFDEQISSRLASDAPLGAGPYEYQRAERFERAIRGLGVSGDGLSYLGRCRQLVTQIGGALGFVRLVRSGGLHCASGALQFVPDLARPGELGAAAERARLGPTGRAAAHTLDTCLADLTGNGVQNMDFFHLLEEALAPALRHQRNVHLRAFHLLVPPLCINHVQHVLEAKERLVKGTRAGALFTEDGFAMGVAFLLKLLALDGAFDALYWWRTVRARCQAQLAAAVRQADGADAQLQHAVGLTLTRLRRSQTEYDLLFYNMAAARVFFREAAAV
ncbi:WASH complex subunit 4 [Amphibalanus amphitrite]|uniref:WASH complex subunit 4 n=1 Tax=Amphibalanus amphitrite TaxID=1232801 RepID=A0A6A4VDU8_AMPAM|nr:WASH complex subunit 4-like [Amphibalanus amphitrite]KAF0292065.1 WASH complex subunit 4 [Amphibalanus amphitrite]KAF0311931.1 WASH complex subunit 4 [Amphibalanus amphitrite]